MTLLFLGCDPAQRAVGNWGVVSIDGVGLAASTGLRVPVPAGVYGGDTLTEGWMWKEYMLESLVLDLRSDGTFTERKVEASSAGVTRSSFGLVRPDYAPMFGGELDREDAEPGVHVIEGTWSAEGNALRLAVTRDALLGDVGANLDAVLPDASDAIRQNLEGSFPREVPPRWVGVRKGDRLEMSDPQGRSFVFRKSGTTR